MLELISKDGQNKVNIASLTNVCVVINKYWCICDNEPDFNKVVRKAMEEFEALYCNLCPSERGDVLNLYEKVQDLDFKIVCSNLLNTWMMVCFRCGNLPSVASYQEALMGPNNLGFLLYPCGSRLQHEPGLVV